MYEHRKQALLPRRKFYGRVAKAAGLGLSMMLGALLIGTVGYHACTDLTWLDSEYNAAMILTGMGPTAPMPTSAAKVWASIYALFSGVVFLTSAGIFFAPLMHRLMHTFHLESRE